MVVTRIFRTLVTGAVIVAGSSAAYSAPITTSAPVYGVITSGTLYDYSTYYTVPAASGSLHFSGAMDPAGGGLCEASQSPCGTVTLTPGAVQGPIVSSSYGTTAAAGLIQIDTPAAIANYQLTIAVTNKTSGKGDIYDIVVNGNSLGTTTIVDSADGTGSGSFSTVINGGGTHVYISVTDLLQQYNGSKPYDLPSRLGGSTDLNNPSGLGPTYDTQSLFTLQASMVLDPEPASLSIFAAGTFALSFARRRARGKGVKAAI